MPGDGHSDLPAAIKPWIEEFEHESKAARASFFEVTKIVLQQAFLLNWGGLVAIPAYAALVGKERIVWLTFSSLVCFAIGILIAFVCSSLIAFTYLNLSEHAERLADQYMNLVLSRIVENDTRT